MIPGDLKDYRPGFQLFTSEEAGSILAVLFAGLIVVDLATRLFGWMFE